MLPEIARSLSSKHLNFTSLVASSKQMYEYMYVLSFYSCHYLDHFTLRLLIETQGPAN